MLISFLGDLL